MYLELVLLQIETIGAGLWAEFTLPEHSSPCEVAQ